MRWTPKKASACTFFQQTRYSKPPRSTSFLHPAESATSSKALHGNTVKQPINTRGQQCTVETEANQHHSILSVRGQHGALVWGQLQNVGDDHLTTAYCSLQNQAYINSGVNFIVNKKYIIAHL